jgi:nucleotide-binding universal stress UspA family protein
MIKDIMVHLDGSAADDNRLDQALAVAAAGPAQLIGMLTNTLPDLTVAMPVDGSAAAIAVLTELEQRARQEGDAIASRLTKRLAGLPVPAELRRLDDTFDALALRVAEQARCADLFLASRPSGKPGEPDWTDLVESVLFGSGRALLLVPEGHRWREPAGTVLVAWNGAREAARALREGLSFIERAAKTVVLRVDPPENTDTADDVKRHLTRHAATVEVVTLESEGRSIADVIAEEARRLSADLVVMGGYGHMRLRERVFGGATFDMLSRAAQPLLLAH